MNQSEYYHEAVKAYQDANKKLKLFAECCYHVSGKETAKLALDCGCEVDTVENYRNAYRLYVDLQEHNIQSARKLWESANISLWIGVAIMRNRHNISLEDCLENLQIAKENRVGYKTVMAQMDNKHNPAPLWERALRQVMKSLGKIRAEWITAMPRGKREQFEQAVSEFTKRLQEIARDEVSP